MILGSLAAGAAAGAGCHVLGWTTPASWFYAAGAVVAGFMLFFYRDPSRETPSDPSALVSGADGIIRQIKVLPADNPLGTEAVRISIFLSPLDVHVNRTPVGGTVKNLGYTPGKHILTLMNAASEYNEHSTILIEGGACRCVVRQIVGPLVRRVVYWLRLEQQIEKGDRIGMMKFGSRLDMYFPKSDVRVLVKKGDRVRGGETVVATLVGKEPS